MDFPVQRRAGGAKYGRNQKKSWGYNFFNDESNHETARVVPAALKTRYPISPYSPGNELQQADEPVNQPVSPSPSSAIRPAHVTSHSVSPFPSDHASRSQSPLKTSPETSGHADASLFDVMSSSDEGHAKSARPIKRRRITQTVKQSKHEKTATVPETLIERPQSRATAEKAQHTTVQPLGGGKKQNRRPIAAKNPEFEKPIPALAPAPVITEEPKPRQVITMTKLKRATYSKKNALPTLSQPPVEDDVMEDNHDPVPSITKANAKTKVRTKPPHIQTPRKRRAQSTEQGTPAPSPGQLGLGELRLTPEKGSRSRASSVISSMSSVASPTSGTPSPRRSGRQRRIDMLDAPKEKPSQPSTRGPSRERSVSRARNQLKTRAEDSKPESGGRLPGLVRSGSSQTRQTYGRAKNTYGKERSHLADMVTDLEYLSQASSQEASQQLASQLVADSGPSQLQQELELEDSSGDDAMGMVKLKSIHELRQAGTNNRFERELEALMEDIDPISKAKSASKSLRLHALMKLFIKLNDDTFASFVSDRALDRLVLCCQKLGKSDWTARIVLNMVLWKMVYTKNASATKWRSICQAVASGTAQITNLLPFASMVTESKPALPQAIQKDLLDFEEIVLRRQILPGYEGLQIIPAAVTIGALNDALRKLSAAGASVAIGIEAFKNVSKLLDEAVSATSGSGDSHMFITKLALSLLYVFAGTLDGHIGLANLGNTNIDATLAKVIERAVTDDNEPLVQPVLHLAISLCNDRPKIGSDFLRRPAHLAQSLMDIITTRFSPFVEAASQGETVDTIKLDTIILCLAGLLNITEHSDEVRRDFVSCSLGNSKNGPDHIWKLFDIYKSVAPKLENATTMEQGQVLVAFGYLSLLLCNLLRDEGVRGYFEHNRGGFQVSDIVVSAKTLLIHLKTLESVQVEGGMDMDMSGLGVDGGGTPDGFTQRFGVILEAVMME